MKISTKGRYGLRALIDIAASENEGFVTLKSVAQRQGISESYLEQLIRILKKDGFVKSVRGAKGGYSLNCDPKTTTVRLVLMALEGELSPVDCLSNSDKSSCGLGNCSLCVTKPVWERMYDSLNKILDSVSLYDLVTDYKCLQGDVNNEH